LQKAILYDLFATQDLINEYPSSRIGIQGLLMAGTF